MRHLPVMYLLVWNPEKERIEATFGGHVKASEAKRFLADIRSMIDEFKDREFSIVIDTCTARAFCGDVELVITECRELALFAGTSRFTYVTRDDAEARRWTGERLDGVMEGREQYISYRSA